MIAGVTTAGAVGDGQIGEGRYEAEITWTTHAVPHVRAGDWGSLGFGQGFACAGHHFPTIADQACKVRGERARHLGRGAGDRHLHSDVGYRALGLHAGAAAVLDRQPPAVRELVTGYAAGVSAWLAAGGRDRLPAWCADASWILPVSPLDVVAYAGDLARAAGARNLVELIALARPPGPEGPAPAPPLDGLPPGLAPGLASNGWAVGHERSATGHGILVANPHFPWYGEARFWECHLTIPGELDVYGVALVGTPGVQIGFNRHVAWTHTFSVGKRLAIYRLTLVPGRPTAYLVDGEEREMTAQPVAVEVLGEDGALETVEQTIWRSEHGPMLNLPLFGWSEAFGFTYRDANEHNDRLFSQWTGMARAGSLDELREVFRRECGVPWATTQAVDAGGRAWWVDASPTPNLSGAALDRYRRQLAEDPLTQLFDRLRTAYLDGSDSAFDWVDDPAAAAPGLVPFDRMPQLERSDWVVNANESHWLANPAEPLTGYSVLAGDEGAPPSPRTRAGFTAVGTAGAGPDGRVSAAELEGRLLSNRSVLAEALCPGVVERLRAAGLHAAAEVLERWDHTYDVGARGAALWRETMAGLPDGALRGPGPLFASAFSPADPLSTPAGLAPVPAEGPDPVVEAVAGAVRALEAAGVAIDAPLGEVQWVMRGAQRVAVHGGQEVDGVCNVLTPRGDLPSSALEPPPASLAGDVVAGRSERTGLRAGGYEVTYGTSFVMVVEMRDEGPWGRGLLAYGQSEDPASPHHADQVGEYVAKRLRPLRFSPEEISADPALRRETVRGPRP